MFIHSEIKPDKEGPDVVEDEDGELLDVVGGEVDFVEASRSPLWRPCRSLLSVMRLSKGTWELAVHVPHVGLALAVQDAQVLLGVHFDSVISFGISAQAPLPVVLNGDNKLIASRVVSLKDLNRPVVDVVVYAGMNEVRGIDRVLVNRICTSHGLSILPASGGDKSVEIGFYGEIKIAILYRNINFILSQFAVVVLFVVPGIAIAFVISVVSNLEIGETVKEVGAVHEEDAVVLGCVWVDAVRDLRLVSRSPSCVA